jgi:hypothetical protein
MKFFYTFLLILAMGTMLSSCLKGLNNGPAAETSLVGKWSIISDSTTTQFWGIWSDEPQKGTVYFGKPADYYNFLPDGTVYTSLEGGLDTATYVQLKNDTLEFVFAASWRDPQKFIISNHTAQYMTLTDAFPFISPETVSSSIIYLKRQ